MKASLIEYDLIRELFDYKDGELIRKVNRGCTNVGDTVGGVDKKLGYVRLTINNSHYSAHRVIWVWHFGGISDGLQIDHINGDRSDNHIDNLRLVTQQENTWNRTKAKGYYWNKKRGQWLASIMVDNTRKLLGLFIDEQSAREAYLDAKKELHLITEK